MIRLYGYWRSSATWRVRIALRWKGLACETVPINLLQGEQSTRDYALRNPQGLIPFLEDGQAAIGQSLAIVEYLEEAYPAPPLLPGHPADRARARMLAQMVACDIHPLNNLRVQKHLRRAYDLDQPTVDGWARTWIEAGFAALEAEAARIGGAFLAGDAVTLADVCLVPQLYNARRVAADLAPYPRLRAIEARLLDLPAFAETRPEAQPDAVPA